MLHNPAQISHETPLPQNARSRCRFSLLMVARSCIVNGQVSDLRISCTRAPLITILIFRKFVRKSVFFFTIATACETDRSNERVEIVREDRLAGQPATRERRGRKPWRGRGDSSGYGSSEPFPRRSSAASSNRRAKCALWGRCAAAHHRFSNRQRPQSISCSRGRSPWHLPGWPDLLRIAKLGKCRPCGAARPKSRERRTGRWLLRTHRRCFSPSFRASAPGPWRSRAAMIVPTESASMPTTSSAPSRRAATLRNSEPQRVSRSRPPFSWGTRHRRS